MAKGTFIFFFILSLLAIFLLGINIGKKIGSPGQQLTNTPTLVPAVTFPPAIFSSPSAVLSPKKSGISTISDKNCGFSLKFPSSYFNQKSENGKSYIITNPDNPSDVIVTACQEEIPRPPLSSDKIESILLDGAAATLYHDQSAKDGSPRDEVIVKHPTNGMEIIIAGFGPTFKEALSSFKFVR